MKSREMQKFWRHTYDFFADSSKSTTISQLCALFVDEQNCWTRQLNTAVLQLLFLAGGLSYRRLHPVLFVSDSRWPGVSRLIKEVAV